MNMLKLLKRFIKKKTKIIFTEKLINSAFKTTILLKK
jgi:hypothetical protein